MRTASFTSREVCNNHVLEEENVGRPFDAISEAGSISSTMSLGRRRAAAIARKRGLKSKYEFMKEKLQREMEMKLKLMELQFQIEENDFDTELKVIEALEGGTGSAETSLPARSHNACGICKANHEAIDCRYLLEKSPEERFKLVHRSRLCLNCLMGGHVAKECKADIQCTVAFCGQKHSSVLHQNGWKKRNIKVRGQEEEKIVCSQDQFQSLSGTPCRKEDYKDVNENYPTQVQHDQVQVLNKKKEMNSVGEKNMFKDESPTVPTASTSSSKKTSTSLAERKTDRLSDLASKARSSSSTVSLAKRRAAAEARIRDRAKRLLCKKFEVDKKMQWKKMEIELESVEYKDEMVTNKLIQKADGPTLRSTEDGSLSGNKDKTPPSHQDKSEAQREVNCVGEEKVTFTSAIPLVDFNVVNERVPSDLQKTEQLNKANIPKETYEQKNSIDFATIVKCYNLS